MNAAKKLRDLRQRLGISVRDVEQESVKIANTHGNRAFAVSNAFLSKLETGRRLPSVYKLFSLSAIYRVRFSDLLRLLGVDLEWLGKYQLETGGQQTFLLSPEKPGPDSTATFPVRFDPGFRVEETDLISRMVEVWGEVPVSFIQQFDVRHNQYGYVGLHDYTMYPLLRPGSFVLIDPELRKVQLGPWRNELDRPIYFVELHNGYACCWCEMDRDQLLLVPHPLSTSPIRRFDAAGAEIVGQVVAIASRIVDPTAPEERPSQLPPRFQSDPNIRNR